MILLPGLSNMPQGIAEVSRSAVLSKPLPHLAPEMRRHIWLSALAISQGLIVEYSLNSRWSLQKMRLLGGLGMLMDLVL
jgi:hypothetical protein